MKTTLSSGLPINKELYLLRVTPSVHCIHTAELAQMRWPQRPALTLKGPAGAVQGEEPVLGIEALGSGSRGAVISLHGRACSVPQCPLLSNEGFGPNDLQGLIRFRDQLLHMMLGRRQVYAFSGLTSWPFSR